ncbi:SAM-dependent methyltransferase [Spirillospora sp. NPDC048911]|uniref:SAM-dependent methyltransferase n=1 Tax=Spirillospora sp. NPDC048911 TaxID=3364527 RepID=UPI0037122ACD
MIAHGNATLASNADTAVVQADIRNPDAVLGTAKARRLLDPSRPTGILLTSVLHHLHDDDDPHGIARAYVERFPAGSMLAVSHFPVPADGGPLARQAAGVERALVAGLGSGWFRSRAAIAAFFDGLDLDEQGLVPMSPWRRDHGPVSSELALAPLMLCGLAHKPR